MLICSRIADTRTIVELICGNIWMMFRGRIAAVSYLNTVPFIYGMEHANLLRAELLLSPPSRCFSLFESGEADIALVPVGALISYPDNYQIVTSFCIGASAPVRTVALMSHSPLTEIRRIHLDAHSRTSVLLVQVLCRELWNIAPEFVPMEDYSVAEQPEAGDAFLFIGDKVFDYETRFPHIHDLAEGWQRLTGLPFVFAVWVAKPDADMEIIEALQQSLDYGTRHIREAIAYYGHSGKPYAYDYLTHNIDFNFDDRKRKALSLFMEKGRMFAPRVEPG
jgi:chorismate dehydratase